jgi:16S rRNA (cytidine1402-2'-O)-methyltransferase
MSSMSRLAFGTEDERRKAPAPMKNVGISGSEETSRSERTFIIHGAPIPVPPLEAGLYVVATPIGNLADVTLRALAVLAGADGILAEDTRLSRTLLAHYGIETPLSSYHEHNAAEARPRALRRMTEGQALALISDAGTPLISDPGYKLVAESIAAGLRVTAAPGASAALAALCVAGLPTDRFFFEGFLPPRSAARRERINALANVSATLVFYEAPARLAESLADLALELGPRPAAVARELTRRSGAARSMRWPRNTRPPARPKARWSSSSAPASRERRSPVRPSTATSSRRCAPFRSRTPPPP